MQRKLLGYLHDRLDWLDWGIEDMKVGDIQVGDMSNPNFEHHPVKQSLKYEIVTKVSFCVLLF